MSATSPEGPDDDRSPEAFVHETASVEADATIRAASRIWHHAQVRDQAVVGANCTVGKGVFIDTGVIVGDGCKIQNYACLYAGVRLEAEVFVGPGAVFTNDRYPRANSPDWTPVPTIVRRGASIGANATVICGVEIGEWATVAAGAVVTKDVAAHELVAGSPARRVGWVCECGRVLQHVTGPCAPVICPSCARAFEGSAG